MTTTIQLPGRLTDSEVVGLPNTVDYDCIVDGSNVCFVEPTGLVQLALLFHRLRRNGADITFLAPGLDVHSYLQRMNFYERLPSQVSIQSSYDVRRFGRSDCSDVLVELTPFRTAAEVENASEQAITYLQRKGLPRPVYKALQMAIPELCDNVVTHSGSQCGGFLSAQTYSGSTHYLAVGDAGIGIREHLTRNLLYADIQTDVHAIEMAMKPDVTGTCDHRGWGLDEILSSLKETTAAELLIRSGQGLVRTAVGNQRVRQSRKSTTAISYAGTLVQVIIRKP